MGNQIVHTAYHIFRLFWRWIPWLLIYSLPTLPSSLSLECPPAATGEPSLRQGPFPNPNAPLGAAAAPARLAGLRGVSTARHGAREDIPDPAALRCLLFGISQGRVISFSNRGMSGVTVTLIISAPLLGMLNWPMFARGGRHWHTAFQALSTLPVPVCPRIGCFFCRAPAMSWTWVRTVPARDPGEPVPGCCGQRGPLSHPHLPVVQPRTVPAARAQGAALEEQCLLVLLKDDVSALLAAESSPIPPGC